MKEGKELAHIYDTLNLQSVIKLYLFTVSYENKNMITFLLNNKHGHILKFIKQSEIFICLKVYLIFQRECLKGEHLYRFIYFIYLSKWYLEFFFTEYCLYRNTSSV